jgi:hypothetical protein
MNGEPRSNRHPNRAALLGLLRLVQEYGLASLRGGDAQVCGVAVEMREQALGEGGRWYQKLV